MLHFTCITSCFIWIYGELYHWLKWKFQWQGKPEFWLIINVDIWNYPRDVTYRSSTSWSVETLQLMYETGIMPWYKWIVTFYISWIYCRASEKIFKHNFGDGRFGSVCLGFNYATSISLNFSILLVFSKKEITLSF